MRATDAHLEVHPLTHVASFAATRLLLRGIEVAVVWDASGSRYAHGAGLHVWMDGAHVGSAPPQLRDGRPTPRVLRVAWSGRRAAAA